MRARKVPWNAALRHDPVESPYSDAALRACGSRHHRCPPGRRRVPRCRSRLAPSRQRERRGAGRCHPHRYPEPARRGAGGGERACPEARRRGHQGGGLRVIAGPGQSPRPAPGKWRRAARHSARAPRRGAGRPARLAFPALLRRTGARLRVRARRARREGRGGGGADGAGRAQAERPAHRPGRDPARHRRRGDGRQGWRWLDRAAPPRAAGERRVPADRGRSHPRR